MTHLPEREDGGREVGDVELAFFKRSVSTIAADRETLEQGAPEPDLPDSVSEDVASHRSDPRHVSSASNYETQQEHSSRLTHVPVYSTPATEKAEPGGRGSGGPGGVFGTFSALAGALRRTRPRSPERASPAPFARYKANDPLSMFSAERESLRSASDSVTKGSVESYHPSGAVAGQGSPAAAEGSSVAGAAVPVAAPPLTSPPRASSSPISFTTRSVSPRSSPVHLSASSSSDNLEGHMVQPGSRSASAFRLGRSHAGPVGGSSILSSTASASVADSSAGIVPEENYRAAMARACADLLGKSMNELEAEYAALGGSVGTGPANSSGRGRVADGIRDFTDYVIIATLKTRDAFAIHNAPSWLFTIMDRNGGGFVLREEFIRYTPYMSPIADAPVASAVFDELIRGQVATQTAEAGREESGAKGKPADDSGSKQTKSVRAAAALHQAARAAASGAAGSRVRQMYADVTGVYGGEDGQHGAKGLAGAPTEMYPVSMALRFPTWKKYFDAIYERYYRKDDDWDRVKRELGLDTNERLIKSQGAIDHSDLWPTLGKLYLSQRYLVFFAAVGRNHYVARLGSITDVGERSMPVLMRDCFTVKLETEAQAAMNGLSAPVSQSSHRAAGRGDGRQRGNRSEGDRLRERNGSSGPKNSDDNEHGGVSLDPNATTLPGEASSSTHRHRDRSGSRGRGDGKTPMMNEKSWGRKEHGAREVGNGGWGGPETPTPQHVDNLMKQFTEVGKPLVFSFIEVRETRRRDMWVAIIKEMSAAHRLHLKLGFGGSGRVVFSPFPDSEARTKGATGGIEMPIDLHQVASTNSDASWNADSDNPSYMTYLMSPFRNEPPPPLLAVAANANVVRYRSLRVLSGSRRPLALLVFSHPERNTRAVTWYVDSVRAHDNSSGRSWIERAFDAILENMEINKRVYNVQDNEPFDVGRLGEGIGRLAELCTPLARSFQFASHILQWRNPPATILALLINLYIIYMGWVQYLPAVMLFALMMLIVATKSAMFGLDGWMWGGGRPEDAQERQANVLELVSQVHDTLWAAQNVIKRVNHSLGKVQTLFLWGTGADWKTWIAVGAIAFLGFLLCFVKTRVIYAMLTIYAFAKHFLPPRNPGVRYWASIPTHVERAEPSRGSGRGGGRREPRTVKTD